VLQAQLRANSSRYINGDPSSATSSLVFNEGVTDRLIVIHSHHTSDSMTNTENDDHDGDDLVELLLRYPNVIMWVNGHKHRNIIAPHSRRYQVAGGFWEVTTASHIDFPYQSRIIEIAGGDSAISIFTTMVDSSGASLNPGTNLGLGMAPGTSPSIAVDPVTGDWRIAFQSNGGQLWLRGNNIGAPVAGQSGVTMMAGTSPSITGLPGGGFQTVFHHSDGLLWGVSPTGVLSSLGLGMWQGSSPSVAAAGGNFQVAFQASTGMLWTRYPNATAENLGLGLQLEY
jgi:hypothetical protein